MKVLVKYLVIIICFLQFYCTGDNPESSNEELTGTLFLKSQPPGARIYLSGNDTGLNTPDSLENLKVGTYDGFLYLQYYDTAYFTVTIYNNLTTTKEYTLKDGLPFVDFVWDFAKYFGEDSVKFSYTINQDVLLDSIIIERPIDSTGSYVRNVFSYNKEFIVSKDVSGNLIKYFLPSPNSGQQYYPIIKNYKYWLGAYGQKAYGAKTEFYVLSSISF